MDDEPILNNREKGAIVKLGLGLFTLVVAAPYVAWAVAIGFLFLVATIGVIAGLADWFLWYGLPTLGVFVVFVLVLRWLFAPRRRDLTHLVELEPRRHEDEGSIDTELEILRASAALPDGVRKLPTSTRRR